MSDDIVFCAVTGRQIIESELGSNVIPFPRRVTDKPKLDRPENRAEQVTHRCNAMFEDLDIVTRAAVAAYDRPAEDSGGI